MEKNTQTKTEGLVFTFAAGFYSGSVVSAFIAGFSTVSSFMISTINKLAPIDPSHTFLTKAPSLVVPSLTITAIYAAAAGFSHLIVSSFPDGNDDLKTPKEGFVFISSLLLGLSGVAFVLSNTENNSLHKEIIKQHQNKQEAPLSNEDQTQRAWYCRDENDAQKLLVNIFRQANSSQEIPGLKTPNHARSAAQPMPVLR